LTNRTPTFMLEHEQSSRSLSMLRANFLYLFVLAMASSILAAQDEGKLKSGPKAGELVPVPFESFNINGPAKGRPHCLVCRFALSPSVLIFAKEPAEGKDAAFNDLLKELDGAMAEFDYRNFSAGVVILSPDARDSTTNAEEKDTAKLIEEAVKREKLLERLRKRAEPFKHVILATIPEAPKNFDINPKADVTVLFYERMKISDNWAFGAGQLEMKDVEAIMKRVREALPLKKQVDGKKG
jgi:hypothetical protein